MIYCHLYLIDFNFDVDVILNYYAMDLCFNVANLIIGRAILILNWIKKWVRINGTE